MSMRKFWFYHRQVSRLRAEEDRRQLGLLASVTSNEGYQSLSSALDKEIGEIFVFEPTTKTIEIDPNARDPEFDKQGLLDAFRRFKGEKW